VSTSAGALEALKQALPDLRIRADQAAREAHAKDWSEAPACLPEAVLYPETTEALSTILRMCTARAQRVVVQGGLTGLSGGAAPQSGELAISLGRMTRIEALEADGSSITVESGVRLIDLQDRLAHEGLMFGIDLPSRGSCTIGGMVATNAGGIGAFRYGSMSKVILGIEAVLGDGRILSDLRGLAKDNSGLRLSRLLIGSEGTLGIVTRVRLAVQPDRPFRATALCALPDLEAALGLHGRLAARFDTAFVASELMWPEFTRFASSIGIPAPLKTPNHALLIELSVKAPGAQEEALAELIHGAMSDGLVTDAVLAKNERERTEIWAIREALAHGQDAFGPHVALDLCLPSHSIDPYFVAAQGILSDEGARRCLRFGHLGDGNIHFLVSRGADHAADEAVEHSLAALAVEMGGSFSAEHGLGTLKRPWLRLRRDDTELELMAGVKALCDPGGILGRHRAYDSLP